MAAEHRVSETLRGPAPSQLKAIVPCDVCGGLLCAVSHGLCIPASLRTMHRHEAEGGAGRRRDREEREREVAEAEQREALKNMTEAERRAWEAAHPKELAEAPKKKWRFLQKYWHKGAFFQARAQRPGPAASPACIKQFCPASSGALSSGTEAT